MVPNLMGSEPDLRARILVAATEFAAEVGVHEMTLARLLARADTNHRAFSRHFDRLEGAVEAAYEEHASALVSELLEVGLAGEDWQSGFRAALERLCDWTRAEPAAAHLLMVEYRTLPQTFAIHQRCAKQLARALDLARREQPLRQPPAMTADLALGAIEAQLGRMVQAGRAEAVGELLPMAAYFGVLLFKGEEAALRELG